MTNSIQRLSLYSRVFVDAEPMYFKNFNLSDIVTPVDADNLEKLLMDTGYDTMESAFLVDGFKNDFDLGYRGPLKGVQRTAHNLKLRVGSETILWNKVMKEVEKKRFAGPYKDPPLKDFIQSPIGLVLKNGGKDTRLIFHLSHPMKGGFSINSETPSHMTSVKYPDFSEAILQCMKSGVGCSISKSDMKSAFRNFGIKMRFWACLILKAKSPFGHKFYYFVDKCLPFRAAISCSHFKGSLMQWHILSR